MLPKKWQNYGLWVSVASLLLMILQDIGFQVSDDRYNMYIKLILSILVLAGIISSPEKNKFYSDK